MSLLTDQIFATGVSLNDLIHIVVTGDTSQNPAGSSFKASLNQVLTLISGATYSSGNYLPLSGGTVTGNTYFGVTSGITIDQVNDRIGVGTSNPQYTLEIYEGSGSVITYKPTAGGTLELSGSTDLPRYSVGVAASGANPLAGMSVGIRDWDDVTYPGYGAVGDSHLYASNASPGLNIINRQGTSTPDYIRFYAGSDATNPSDVHIQGSGTTRGYVGFGTENPTEKLDVNGSAIIQDGLTASTMNISTTPTTDTSLSANYLTRDGSTGQVKVKTIPGPTVYGLFAQTGNSIVVSATTVESSLIGEGIGSLSIPANGFSVGDSFRADFGGLLSSKNADTIRIRVKSGSIILADSGDQTMNAATNDVWQLSINFTIRQVGAAGTASIVSLGVFHTTKQSNGSPEGFAFNTVNNTTFDTTSTNTLETTVQFSSNSTSNSIYSDTFVLNKIF